MLDRLDPQAKVLLEQLAASTAEEPLPHQPLSSAEQIAAARLDYQQIAQLAGEVEFPLLTLPSTTLRSFARRPEPIPPCILLVQHNR